MGSRNNPGKYDCFSKAEPDEPTFTLLGRDPAAPILIELWVEIRKRMGESFEKLNEAVECAEACEEWLGKKEKGAAYEQAIKGYREVVIEDATEEVKLSLIRQYAAVAMQGLIAKAEGVFDPKIVAKDAVRFAEALAAELESKEQ